MSTDPAPVLPPPRTSRKTIVIASIVVLVAFVAGAFTGVLVDHLLHRGRGRTPHMGRMTGTMAAHLDRRLDLTDAQREKIEEILRRRHRRMWELSESVRPQIHKEIQATNAEIERVLTPEQREKFQQMKMRMRFGPHGRHPEGKRRRESTR